MKLIRFLLLPILFTFYTPSINEADSEYIYQGEGKSYPYRVLPTGDNYHFEFDEKPQSMDDRQSALEHVLDSIYNDSSINFKDRKNYMRERAKCSFFGSTYYDYTLCVLPNEFSTKKSAKLRGFVTQLPNLLWFLTRLVLPGAVIGLLLYLVIKRKLNDNSQ